MDRSCIADRPCRGRASARLASASERSGAPSSVCEGGDFSAVCVPPQLQLVQQERRFYFIGRTDRRVIFSVLADSLDDAWAKFRASGRSDSDALFIIKTETEIYLA